MDVATQESVYKHFSRADEPVILVAMQKAVEEDPAAAAAAASIPHSGVDMATQMQDGDLPLTAPTTQVCAESEDRQGPMLHASLPKHRMQMRDEDLPLTAPAIQVR